MIDRNTKKTSKWFILRTGVLILLTVSLVSACGFGKKTQEAEGKQAVSSEEDLVLSVNDISNTVSFYPVDVDGTQMEVLAVKAPDGTIRTAFNTCQVCYDSGRGYYKQEGDVLVCQNCGNRFAMDRVEVEAGGCNPWPIFDKSKTVTEESITISSEFLKESKQIFENWKTSY
ncbi:DUF2318 domain-containing protein [Clostridium sp. E02]|uniref:DUF2318 domain-containing protein n=1 Tax=Clostridium sp. E02 TaxID=2487134 RepID=UPI000F54BE5B|nr:DUF2318 domain-containing protein [Clostridium sp. E02]